MTCRPKIARTTRKLRRLVAARRADPHHKPTENEKARAAGITKRMKQYVNHYNKNGGVEGLVACHLQNPALMLDHGRDRAARILTTDTDGQA